MLDIIRAAVFQKALDSTKKITTASLTKTVPTAAFWVVFTDAWAFLSIALPKLGVGILIIRIFRPQRWLRISILALCVALNILAIVGFIMTFVQCDPVAGQWDPFRYPQTQCWERSIQIIYSCTVGGISAFTDIAFSVYPCIVVWGLQMATWRKLSTMALMSLGFASFAFAIVKLVSNTALLGSPDINKVLYNGIQIGIWNSIENDFVLSAACLPSVPPFFRACKTFFETHTSPFEHTYLTSFRSPKPPSRPRHADDNWATELAHNAELPGTSGGKNGNDYSESE
ncbi:MAG: hypothetical protein Q9201_003274 [Fulgogasparrea decipioides]